MENSSNTKVLITGALGQIGSELSIALGNRYGSDNVIASDIRDDTEGRLSGNGIFMHLDVLSFEEIETVLAKYGITVIYHLAAMLSAVAEKDPQRAWKINMGGLYNVLEAVRKHGCSIFFPSSIGAFGLGTLLDGTPQDAVMRPSSMYGVTKVSGELLCDYYHGRYGVDTRGVRYPGIISNGAMPGGGTTDYAVEIFYAAIREKRYTCFLEKDTSLDMMYMPDAIKAAIDLMEADPNRLHHRNAFNVSAMHFTPEDLAAEIKKHIPDFEMDYNVDPIRQKIADSWPNYMDDSTARREWGWKPVYTIESMTEDMLRILRKRYDEGLL
ncbi:MAG: NAD-dependent epimerase/dehydratase family protein [bacterium]|nr:MAG: NAD-dependent epimerase/dehydratase family protein [bacterium]